LFAAIDRIAAASAAAASHSGLAQIGPLPKAKVLDTAALLERVEGDTDLLEELVRLFARESPGNMAAIGRARDAHDAILLEQLAHTLRGASANLGAERVLGWASSIESHARAQDWETAGASIESLQIEVGRLLSELDSFCRSVAP
jgi:HPt (histidine-containing phosphotransfer) domain-containing protein